MNPNKSHWRRQCQSSSIFSVSSRALFSHGDFTHVSIFPFLMRVGLGMPHSRRYFPCSMQSRPFRSHGLWQRTRSKGFKWVQMGSNGFKWVQMGSNGFKWVQSLKFKRIFCYGPTMHSTHKQRKKWCLMMPPASALQLLFFNLLHVCLLSDLSVVRALCSSLALSQYDWFRFCFCRINGSFSVTQMLLRPRWGSRLPDTKIGLLTVVMHVKLKLFLSLL